MSINITLTADHIVKWAIRGQGYLDGLKTDLSEAQCEALFRATCSLDANARDWSWERVERQLDRAYVSSSV